MRKKKSAAILSSLSELAATTQRLESRVEELRHEMRRLAELELEGELLEAAAGGTANKLVDGIDGFPVPALVRITVHFSTDADFLRFMDELASRPEVASATVAGSQHGEATVLVELVGSQPAEFENPTVRCVRCDMVLRDGTSAVSHGLCEECEDEFIRFRG